MKQSNLFKPILLAIAVLLTALPASAYDFMVDGLCYNRNCDRISVTVTHETISLPRYTSLSGSLTIPETVTYSGETNPVTFIGLGMFADCSGLKNEFLEPTFRM